MGDKAISMGALAKLKQKAAGARRRVSTKREALGQTNERGGPDSPRESLGAVPHIEPVKKKGFLAKMKGLLPRGKSKSGRSSNGERKNSGLPPNESSLPPNPRPKEPTASSPWRRRAGEEAGHAHVKNLCRGDGREHSELEGRGGAPVLFPLG